MFGGGVILFLSLCFMALHCHSVEGRKQDEYASKIFKLLHKDQQFSKTQQSQANGGLTYVRWGRTTCPNTPGTQLVYAGRAGGSLYKHEGGGANYLCMPPSPDYALSYKSGVRDHSYVYGGEYHLPIRGGHDYNVPCAVCYTNRRETVLNIPAKAYCPTGWTREYYGYLMSEYKGNREKGWHHGRTMFTCVDKDPEAVPGSYEQKLGVLFYHVEASCNGMPCPPYDPNKELNCVVCTR